MRLLCDYLAFVNFGFAIIFFIFNCGVLFYQEDKKFKLKLEKLKQKEGEEEQS